MSPTDIPSNNHSTVWNWKDILVIILGIIFLFAIGVILLIFFPRSGKLWGDTASPTIILYNIIIGAIESTAIIVSIYFLGIRRKKSTWALIGLRYLSTKWFIISLLLSIAAMLLSSMTATAVQAILGKAIENPQLDFLAPQGFSWLGFFGMLAVGGILAPFAEEILFRGVLFGWIRPKWGFWPSALITSTLFGILHGEISIIVAAFLLGILLCWVYERSQSLWSSIIIHMINNSFKIIVLYLFLYYKIIIPGVTSTTTR